MPGPPSSRSTHTTWKASWPTSGAWEQLSIWLMKPRSWSWECATGFAPSGTAHRAPRTLVSWCSSGSTRPTSRAIGGRNWWRSRAARTSATGPGRARWRRRGPGAGGVVIGLCGFEVGGARREAASVTDADGRALVQGGAFIDGNAYTSRPGPRLADAAELLARLMAG